MAYSLYFPITHSPKFSHQSIGDCNPSNHKQSLNSTVKQKANNTFPAQKDFEALIRERNVIENLNALEELIQDASRRKARSVTGDIPPTPYVPPLLSTPPHHPTNTQRQAPPPPRHRDPPSAPRATTRKHAVTDERETADDAVAERDAVSDDLGAEGGDRGVDGELGGEREGFGTGGWGA